MSGRRGSTLARLSLLGLCLMGLCARDRPPPASAGVVGPTITFSCCSYAPAELSITLGETVTWSGSLEDHPLVSDDGLWSMQSTGGEFSHTFNAPGLYRYYCEQHGGPNGAGMSGWVEVAVEPTDFVYLPLVAK